MSAQCRFCFLTIDGDQTEHEKSCYDEQMNALAPYEPVILGVPETVVEPKLDLTKTQKKVLRNASKKAKVASKNTKHLLVEKMVNIGYDPTDYDVLRRFVRNAEIVMRVPMFSRNLIDTFLDSPYLCNVFEVSNIKHLAGRSDWESGLFDKLYDDSEPGEKVKYAAFNIDNNPNGVLSARSYGDVNLVFKPEIRKRTTFVYGDSSVSCGDMYLSTYKYCNNILYFLSNEVLDSVIKKAKGDECRYNCYPYIEAQIHGDLRIDRDVLRIVVDRDKNDPRLRDLCDKYGVELVIL